MTEPLDEAAIQADVAREIDRIHSDRRIIRDQALGINSAGRAAESRAEYLHAVAEGLEEFSWALEQAYRAEEAKK